MQPMTIVDPDEVEAHPEKPRKGCNRVEVSRGVSFAFFIISFVILIIAFGSPNWYEVEEGSLKYTTGLWMFCRKGFFTTGTECEQIFTGRPSQLTVAMRALQANMCLAMIGSGMSLVCYIAWFRRRTGKGAVAFISAATHAFAGITTVAAVGLFGHKFRNQHEVLGWSFILACISGGLQTLTGLITLFALPCAR